MNSLGFELKAVGGSVYQLTVPARFGGATGILVHKVRLYCVYRSTPQLNYCFNSLTSRIRN